MASVSFAPSVPFKFSEADKKPVEDESEEDLYAKYKALLRQEEFLDLQVYFHSDLHALCQGLLSTP
jgi:hypothetical protein